MKCETTRDQDAFAAGHAAGMQRALEALRRFVQLAADGDAALPTASSAALLLAADGALGAIEASNY